MDFNKIQDLLEKLPDQQIMQYAQGSNPQVPQILAQMEAARRENMRKSEVMQGPGIMGMYKGGAVRGYNKGGKAEATRSKVSDRLAREKEEEEKSERASGIMAVAPQQKTQAELMSEGYSAQWNQAADNMRRNAQDAATKRAEGVLAMGPTEFQKNPANLAPVAPPTPTPEAPPARDVPKTGIDLLGTPQAKPVQGPAPSVGTGAPPPEAMQKLAEATDAQSTKFAEAYKSIFADRDAMRQAGQSAAPDMDKERRMAFFYGLAKFGATLATTGVLARAGDVGLEAFRSELEKSKEKQDQFRKESLEIGLAALDDKLKMLGIEQGLSDKEKQEARQALEDMRKDKELKLKEREVTAKEKLTSAQINATNASAEKDRAEIGSSGPVLKEKDRAALRAKAYQDAMTQFEAPQYRKLTLEEKDRLASAAADKAVNFALGATSTSTGANTGTSTGAKIAPPGWKLVK